MRTIERIFSKIDCKSPARSTRISFLEPKPTVEPGWNSQTHTAKAHDIHVAPLSRDFSTGAEVFVVKRSYSHSMNSRWRGNSTTGSITGSPELAFLGSYR